MNRPQVVDLNQSILHTAELAQTEICSNGVLLDLKLSSKSPRVLANPAELTQALLNLLNNAIEAVSSVGTSGKIQITSAVIRDHVLVSVMDDAPATSTVPREGLRLYRNMIREIGGDMWMSSGEAQGTTFTIDLPSAPLN